MDKTVQANVRVGEADRVLIVTLAQRLRNDPGFHDRLKALLENDGDASLVERVKKLEQQVSWLLSGAIVVPRSAPRVVAGVGASNFSR
ncbi:MAG TPA: hypothetical protein VGL83_06475 [Stellaceae bacterium]|jgi:hypothetical protein